MASREVLMLIQGRDPDGGSRQPTSADYERFRMWVIDNYGLAIWVQYMQSNWDEREYV